MRPRLVPTLITIASSAVWAAAAADPGFVDITPLHVIAIENGSDAPVPAGAPLRVRLHTADAPALAARLNATTTADGNAVDYVIDAYPQRPAGARSWLESTFVVDHDQPVFEPLKAQLGAELAARGARVTRAALVDYVAALLEETGDRGWDLASVVARRRAGDCTEHAVLTAALARLEGIPARVVIGVLLVSKENDYAAFGHAWAELLEDGRWQIADAALAGLDATVRYLPFGHLENEGPGYGMELSGHMQIWVDRVEVLGPDR